MPPFAGSDRNLREFEYCILYNNTNWIGGQEQSEELAGKRKKSGYNPVNPGSSPGPSAK